MVTLSKNKTVVVLCDKLSDRVFLLGKLWRLSGSPVMLVYRQENPTFSNSCFDDFDSTFKVESPIEAILICKRVCNPIIHYFFYSADEVGFLLLRHSLPYILDYKDLFTNTLYPEIQYKNHELEKTIIARARLITHRDRQIFNFLDKNKINFDVNRLIYMPEFFTTDLRYEQKLAKSICANEDSGTVKLIMTGGYPAEHTDAVIAEGISKLLEFLVINEIYIDIVGGFSNVHSLDTSFSSRKLSKLIETGFLKIKPSSTADVFDDNLLNYDFAMHMFNFDFYKSDTSEFINNFEHSAFCGSARIYSFIKACLPIIIGPSLPYVRSVIQGEGFGVYLDAPISNIKSYLLNLKLSGYKRKLLKRREHFGVTEATKRFSDSVPLLLG